MLWVQLWSWAKRSKPRRSWRNGHFLRVIYKRTGSLSMKCGMADLRWYECFKRWPFDRMVRKSLHELMQHSGGMLFFHPKLARCEATRNVNARDWKLQVGNMKDNRQLVSIKSTSSKGIWKVYEVKQRLAKSPLLPSGSPSSCNWPQNVVLVSCWFHGAFAACENQL